jgi:branched-chain amino acid transport system substrate-binding protein
MKLPVALRKPVPTRRAVISGIATGAILSSGFGARRVLAQEQPFRVGMLNTFTGIGTTLGEDNYRGMLLYFDQIGGQAGGRKIELIKEDDEFNPQIGLQKLRKLVDTDRVDIVAGPQASSVAMAALNYVKQSKTLLLVSAAGTDAITWERIPNVFRSSVSIRQKDRPFGAWMYDNVAKSIMVVASDYGAGHDVVGQFKAGYEAKGGTILKEMYPPLNTGDFSVWLTEIRSAGAPAVFAFMPGIDGVRFVKQFDELGLKGKVRLAADSMLESDSFPGEGDSAIGGLTSNMYAESLDTPENRKFRAAYQTKFNAPPSFFSDYGYVAARVIAETITAVHGKTDDPDQMSKAMAAVTFAAPRGPFRFDPETHNVIENIYIKEVVKLDGRLTDRVLATITDARDPGVKD